MFLSRIPHLTAAWLLLLVLTPATARSDSPDFHYVGARKCKMCHNKASTGAQYKLWQQSLHSQAYDNLGSEQAAKYAAERGIKGSPQEAPECLKCHSTAASLSDEDLAKSKIKLEEGVSCESCHGPGSGYAKKKPMQAAYDGDQDPTEIGLIAKPSAEACVRCHNEESPAYKEFHYEEFLAKILHPVSK